ncbi:MAG: bifunctional oligoribonuclease/PAP phosphatase NrnA [Candidatus Omnitrophica bacterium]|nr:bifunctional oligoribonuclease/PAP phosphatase NrnA [Candidatus Omnitrophota bacterium]
MSKGLAAVIRTLKRYNNFLITSHINMEGDAVGSQLAMADILKKMGKAGVIVDNDPIPPQFNFLEGAGKAKTYLDSKYNPEAVIVVDCPVAERTGRVAGYFKKAKVVVNIDHHVSNTRFGDVIWVESGMSSGGEMLYHLYKALGLKIDKGAALNMYVAIATDTGNFTYENTTSRTHRIASALVRAGVKPLWVANHLNESKAASDLGLLRDALGTLETHFSNRVAVLHTSLGMLRKRNVGPSSAEGFVNYARSIKTVDVAVFLLERPDKPGEVHVSFRSKGRVNVNKLAALFGGGGHPNASGCVIRGGISHAKAIVLKKIKPFVI